MIDLLQTAIFLAQLDETGTFTFQTFSESDRATSPAPYPQVRHGTLEQHGAELSRLNDGGAGIFVMVNAGDGQVKPNAKTCRTAENVTRVRAVFVDLDGAPVLPILDGNMPPDWVVQSSPGRWHAYWKVEDCPLDQFSMIQSALAAKFGGDPSVRDLPRVMRLPGFVHWKNDPFVSQLYLPEQFDEIRSKDDD